MFNKLFPSRRPDPKARVPSTDGALVYAIGDVHGRLDLLNQLLEQIFSDVRAQRSARRPVLIFLGDYVDRGPASAGVIDRVISLQSDPTFRVHGLKGNHEAQMLLFREDSSAGPSWAEFGGAQTLLSYGVMPPRDKADGPAWEATRAEFVDALPDSHLAFLEKLSLGALYGDYLFVHAGVRPKVPIDEQDERDLLWIRHEFLNSNEDFGKVVVHGHTPESEPYIGWNRINVDTGAYATGRLSAIRLHGQEQFILQTSGSA